VARAQQEARRGRQRRTIIDEFPPEAPLAPPVSPPLVQPLSQPPELELGEQELVDALAETPRESRAIVYRIEENTGRKVYLCDVSASDVSHAFFQKNFGGGRYRGRVRRLDGQWGTHFNFDIDPRIPAKMPAWITGEGGAPASPPSTVDHDYDRAGGDPDFKNLYALQLLKLVKDSDEMRDRSSQMFMQMMKTMSENTAALVSQVIATRKDTNAGVTTADMLKLSADSRREVLEMMTLADKMRGGNAEASSIERALTLIGKFRAMSDELPEGRGENEPSAFDGVIAELAKVLMPVLAGGLIAKTSPPAPVPELPAGVPSPTTPVPPIPEPAAPAVSPFQGILENLYASAQAADDPGEKAYSFVDMCPPQYLGRVREQAMQPDVVEQIIAVAPQFGEFRGWLTEFVLAVRAEFKPEEPPSGNPENA
jgi:hypothetical protein